MPKRKDFDKSAFLNAIRSGDFNEAMKYGPTKKTKLKELVLRDCFKYGDYDDLKQEMALLTKVLKSTKNIKFLDLTTNNLGRSDDAIIALASGLVPTSVDKLKLSDNNISDSDTIIYLVNNLQNSQVSELILSTNNINTKETINTLIYVLKNNPTITKVDLSHNNIRDFTVLEDIAEKLKETSITSFDLSRNQFENSPGGQAVCIKMESALQSNIDRINGSTKQDKYDYASPVPSHIASGVVQNTPIESSSSLEDDLENALSDAFTSGMAQFFGARKDKLETILENIKKNETSFTEVNLTDYKIDMSGISKLFKLLDNNKYVRIVSLKNCNIGDQGVTVLSMLNSNIERLNIEKNNISDASLDSLANFIKNSKNINYINLMYNNITDFGARKILEILKTNQNIQYCHVGGNSRISVGLLNKIEAQLKINRVVLKHIEQSSSVVNTQQNAVTSQRRQSAVRSVTNNEVKNKSYSGYSKQKEKFNYTLSKIEASKDSPVGVVVTNKEFAELKTQVAANKLDITTIKKQIGEITWPKLQQAVSSLTLDDDKQAILLDSNFQEVLGLLTGHLDNLEAICKNHSALKIKEDEFESLMSQPNAKSYYKNIIAGLGSLHTAARAIGSNLIDPDKQGGLGFLGQVVGAMSGVVPGLSGVGQLAAGLLGKIDISIQKKQIKNIASLAPTYRKMDNISASLAINLIKNNRHNISTAKDDLNIILKNILKGNVSADKDIVSQLESFVTGNKIEQNIVAAKQVEHVNAEPSLQMQALQREFEKLKEESGNLSEQKHAKAQRLSELKEHNSLLEKEISYRLQNKPKINLSLGDKGRPAERSRQNDKEDDATKFRITQMERRVRHVEHVSKESLTYLEAVSAQLEDEQLERNRGKSVSGCCVTM